MKRQCLIMVSVLTLLVVSLLAFPMTGLGWPGVRGSGHVVEEKREVSGVTGVKLAMMGTLYINVGERESLRVEAEDNLLEYIETWVQNGILRIDDTWYVHLRPTRQINYYLTVKTLDTIKISSKGDVQTSALKARRFSVDISSSGNLDMGDLEANSLIVDISSSGNMTIDELHTDSLQVDISSSGNLDITGGKVRQQDIEISSSGDYNARHMESVEAELDISSNGTATIWVTDKLKAKLSSSGDLYFIGDPMVHYRISSSGHIEKIH